MAKFLERKRVARIGIPLLFCLAFFGVQSWLLFGEQQSSGPQILVADSSEIKSNSVLAQTGKPLVLPEALYRKAWILIKQSFYDQKFHGCGQQTCKQTTGQDWGRWEHHYDGKLKTLDDAHKAIETMLYSLADPYTRFLDKSAFDDEKQQIEARLFGVGMQLGMNKEHKVVVIAPIEGTPAFQAGIHSGDEIFEVDGKAVKGQSLDEVVKQIRGQINTKVIITFVRKAERHKVSLTRAEIPIKAVANAEMLPGNLGYIRLDSFISQRATQEMKSALKKLNSADGFIIDLRNNPGGLLANAIEIANIFLDHGIIVSTIDADGYKAPQQVTGSSQSDTKHPLVVLINGGSASASEILSGALRDNGRAKLVGQKSFGKGLVQAINKLEDGSGINVTIAKYLTPNDTDIHKTGIKPDYEVTLKEEDYTKDKGPWWIDMSYKYNAKKSPADGKDVQLQKAIEVLKAEIAKKASQERTTAVAPAQPSGKD